MVESVLLKLAVIHTRLTTLLKRSLHQKAFPVNTTKFSVLLENGLTKASFSAKLKTLYYKTATLLLES